MGQGCLVGVAFITLFSSANALFVSLVGAEQIPWTYVAGAAVVTAAGAAFTWGERRAGLRPVLLATLALLATSMVAHWLGSASRPDAIALAFVGPILMRLFWVMGNLALWSQANRLLDLRQSKRLVPLINLSVVVGIVLWTLAALALPGSPSPVTLLGVAAVSMVAVTGLAAAVPVGSSRGKRHDGSSAPRAPLPRGALRFLGLLLAYDALATGLAYSLDYVFMGVVERRHQTSEALASFFTAYMGGMTLALIVVTLLLSGPVLNRFGIRGGLLPNPVVVGAATLGAAAAVLTGAPDLLIYSLVVAGKGTNETSLPTLTMPAVRVAVQALPRDQQVRALALNDSFVGPLTMGAAGVGLLLLPSRELVGPLPGLLVVSAFALLLAPVGWLLGRRYAGEVRARLRRAPRPTPSRPPPAPRPAPTVVDAEALGRALCGRDAADARRRLVAARAVPPLCGDDLADTRILALAGRLGGDTAVQRALEALDRDALTSAALTCLWRAGHRAASTSPLRARLDREERRAVTLLEAAPRLGDDPQVRAALAHTATAIRRRALHLLGCLEEHATPLRDAVGVLTGSRTGDRTLALEILDTTLPPQQRRWLEGLDALPVARGPIDRAVATSHLDDAPPPLAAALRAALDGDPMDPWDKALALARNPAFADLDGLELASLAEGARPREVTRGEQIIAEGDPSGSAWLVVRGSLEVRTGERLLSVLQAGSIAGEFGLFSPGPRAADVLAAEDGLLLELDPEHLDDLIELHPSVARGFLRSLTDRLREQGDPLPPAPVGW